MRPASTKHLAATASCSLSVLNYTMQCIIVLYYFMKVAMSLFFLHGLLWNMCSFTKIRGQNKWINDVHWSGWCGHSRQRLSQLVATLHCLLYTLVQISLCEGKKRGIWITSQSTVSFMLHCHTSDCIHTVARAWNAKFWIKIKMLADIETQTRGDNYIAGSKKLEARKRNIFI